MSNDAIKILVVEDEEALLLAIQKKLEISSVLSLGARSVPDAIKILEENDDVDAIWLDHYLLGKQDGLDLIKEIRARDEDKDIPVFVVSNTASPEKMDSYLEMGVKKYYTKSNNRLEDIISDIKSIIKK